ncbi:MAG: 50S ribosomal protein L23 [Candidatus Uhrbacteria bacterium]|nr:50S ribosomal protein L23 [Candidatus Uhrbacteria bacterium]
MSILKRKTKKTEEVAVDAQVVAAPVPEKKAAKVKKVAETTTPSTAVKTKTISRFAAETIIAPIVTEKAARMSGANVMVFEVSTKATRVGVKQAIHELYGVMPTKVNIMNVRGTKVRFGRHSGIRKATKKAMVTLPAGKHIDVFAS